VNAQVFQQLGIALGLGLLVGLQREWARDTPLGIRTFPLVSLFGAVCALVAKEHGGWVLGAGMAALGALLVMENLARQKGDEDQPGPTTEVAALLVFGVGAALVAGLTAPAVAVAGAVALLLHWKKPLHHLVERIGQKDVQGIFRLVLIGLVILPVLPDHTYGPYDVLNPFRIWLMVVLIVGISLGGYVAHKYLGAKVGTVLAGVLGGVISSTATTVSYARRSRRSPGSAGLAAVVVMTASTIVFARVAFEIALVAPDILRVVLPPLGAMMGWMAAISIGLYLLASTSGKSLPEAEDPSDLSAAIIFGLLYAVVLLGVAAAKEHFGDRGLYVVAGLSGLTDMDAITLSTAQLVDDGRVTADAGWRMILLGGLSNLVFKAGAVALLGNRSLMLRVAMSFGLALIGGAAILAFWP
jgi:uncharacterized membrane protein (DUF4010 family)